MPDELGTRDVLGQLDTRLTTIEQDLRGFRSEMNARFSELNDRNDRRFAGVKQRFAGVEHRIMWVYGLLVTVLLSVLGLWFK